MLCEREISLRVLVFPWRVKNETWSSIKFDDSFQAKTIKSDDFGSNWDLKITKVLCLKGTIFYFIISNRTGRRRNHFFAAFQYSCTL